MRIMLTWATLVSAVLIPWNSFAPALSQDSPGSLTSGSIARSRPPAARLNPSLGILPISPGSDADSSAVSESGTNAPDADFSSVSGITSTNPRVVCENGVCRLVDDTDSASFAAPDRAQATIEPLRQLQATQIRLDRSENEWRCSCSVPVSGGSKIVRRFEGAGATEQEAVDQVRDLVQAWLQARQ